MTFIPKSLNRKKYLRLLDALLAALLVTLAAYLNLIDDIDRQFSDWLYQNIGEKSPDIIVIGIDAETLDELGPLHEWGRREISKAINYMNDSPDSRPAVIGLDVMFTGDSPMHAEWSKALADAAEKYHNVVVASMAYVDENRYLDEKNNDPYYPWNKVWEWDAPYDDLLNSAETGHINAPGEPDGIVRHALLYVDVEDKGRLYSFSRVIYEKYCSFKGIEANSLPKTVGNGVYYLPFTANDYNSGYNMLDLVKKTIPPEIYKDKIVLIGPYAIGMMDELATAINPTGLTYGIDIHANSIDAFRKNFFPREISETPQLFLIFIIIFFSELFFREGKMKQVVLWWLVTCIGWIVICKLCYLGGIILHVAWIPFYVSIIFIAAVMTNHYMHVNEEDVRIATTFGRYFDPTVMKKLLAGNPDVFKLGGTQQNIAVLFVDIRGFTTMSDRLPAPIVVEILNRYLTLTTECIFKHHGTLDKFIADATMAFWNESDEKISVNQACLSALDMIEGSKKLRESVFADFGVNIFFGIGVNFGHAVVGNIGTANRMDYTAIGDTVNTAARLEANAEGGQILITKEVADILGDSAVVEPIQKEIKLKGKEKHVEILILKSMKR